MRTRSFFFVSLITVFVMLLGGCVPAAAPQPAAAPVQPTAAPVQPTAAPAQPTAAAAQPTAAPAQPTAAPVEPTAAQPTAAVVAGATPLRIAYIPQNTGNPYFERINTGFQGACKQLGCAVTLAAPATADATAQIPFIQEQVQRGIDVLAIQANSVDALNSIFDDVRKKGVLVIETNADITGNETHRDAAVEAVDFTKVGKQMLDRMYDYLGGKGKFAILSATTDAPAQKQWIEDPGGIKDLLKNDPKYKDLQLLEVAYGDDVPQKSTTEAEALLTKYPDMNAIMAPTTVAEAAAAQVLESAGVYPGGPNAKGTGVILYGTGTPNQMRPFIKNGVIKDFDLWDPAKMGTVVVYLSAGLKNGTIKLGEGNTFDVPGLGKETFGKNNLVTVGSLDTFNKDNIDQFNF
jgi:rhamnose transport system substrate-binding protein